MRRAVSTPNAPRPTAGAPYSQAIVADRLVFVSGQLPIDPATGQLVPGGVTEHAMQALRNLTEVLAAAGCGFDDVVRTTVYLRSRADWPAMNDVYAQFVGAVPPARTSVIVAELAFGALVEIDAIAVQPAANPADGATKPARNKVDM